MAADHRLVSQRFPRSSKYHPDWVIASASGGANSLWLIEWLAERLDLEPGMRVLDLGCGLAASSIFLRREYGVQIWATDLWFSGSENLHRIRDAGVEDGVFPMHTDARSLPFAADFFDAVVSIDSFPYYGTDDLYLNYIARFVKAGGALAIAGAGLMQEIDGYLIIFDCGGNLACGACTRQPGGGGTGSGPLSSPSKSPTTMPEEWQAWLAWQRAVAPENATEIEAVQVDRGRFIGYVRLVGRRRPDAQLEEPIVSIPTQYTRKLLLRLEG